MDIRRITPDYAVSPQVDPADLPALAAEGFTTLINNRPDAEVPPEMQSAAMRAAAEAAGLAYVDNPVVNGGLTMDMVTGQGAALDRSDGPVLAYCRTGTRSSIVWALGRAGKMPADDILGALARAGYDLPQLRGQIEALAAQAG